MSRLAPPTIILTAAILLTGCATPDVPTMPNADLGAKARVPGAANFGALVERFPTDFEITWDSDRNVTWTLGLVNPILYGNPDLFRPITEGDNRVGGVGYDAAPGRTWNACTGLGAPKGADVIAALAAAAIPIA